MAVGIVMRDQNVDEDQAFAYLRRSSQDSNRKLRDVAEDVIRDLRSLPDTRRAERLDS
jgi:AmiR/NasT family two-component response regulator